MELLRDVRQPGNRFQADAFSFEIVDIERHRVDRLLVARRPCDRRFAPGLTAKGSTRRVFSYQSGSLPRSRATACPCNWHTRDSETSSTAAISLKLSSCS